MATGLDEMVTVREASRERHRTAETVRRWIWEGKLPAQKLGNQLFVRRADLAQLGSGEQPGLAERLAALDEAGAVRERIAQRIGGTIDILEALDRSREAHP